jgi:hypothetical protein
VGLAAGLLLVGSGCWPSPYSQRLQQTQERLAYLDEENALLGEPLAVPGEFPVPVFFRPPRSLSSAAQKPAYPVPEWLYLCPWHEARGWPAPWELYVGVHPFSGRIEEFEPLLHAELLAALPVAGDAAELLAQRDAVLVRRGAAPGDRLPVRYRCLVYQSLEPGTAPVSPRQSWSATCQVRWEIYLHRHEDWLIVLAFRILDREATERMWLQAGASAAELRKLPVADRKTLAQQRDASLATLRIGAAALAAHQAWRGD